MNVRPNAGLAKGAIATGREWGSLGSGKAGKWESEKGSPAHSGTTTNLWPYVPVTRVVPTVLSTLRCW